MQKGSLGASLENCLEGLDVLCLSPSKGLALASKAWLTKNTYRRDQRRDESIPRTHTSQSTKLLSDHSGTGGNTQRPFSILHHSKHARVLQHRDLSEGGLCGPVIGLVCDAGHLLQWPAILARHPFLFAVFLANAAVWCPPCNKYILPSLSPYNYMPYSSRQQRTRLMLTGDQPSPTIGTQEVRDFESRGPFPSSLVSWNNFPNYSQAVLCSFAAQP